MPEIKKAGPRIKSRRAEQIWKEFEDYLAPLMGMKPGERAVYSYLVRHTRLEGRRGVVLGMPALGRGAGIGYQAARWHLLRLARKGCVKVRPCGGKYAVTVFLPDEVVRALRARDLLRLERRLLRVSKSRVLRARVLRREGGRCFYCRRRLVKGALWFDHVVALARGGNPDESNVVACCRTCNQWKGCGDATVFLRGLYGQKVIRKAQLKKGLASVREILRGKHGLHKAA